MLNSPGQKSRFDSVGSTRKRKHRKPRGTGTAPKLRGKVKPRSCSNSCLGKPLGNVRTYRLEMVGGGEGTRQADRGCQQGNGGLHRIFSIIPGFLDREGG